MPGDDLAAGYVTILPDLDYFVEELAAKVDAATNALKPNVNVEAKLDDAQLAAQAAKAEATVGGLNKTVTTILDADAAPLDVEVASAEAKVKAFEGTDAKAKIGVDLPYLESQLALARSALGAAGLKAAIGLPGFGGLNPLQAHNLAMSGSSGAPALLDLYGLAEAAHAPATANTATGGPGGFLASLFPWLLADKAAGGVGGKGGGSLGGSLFWGGGSGIPLLGGLAGMGSIGSLMGLGPEHLIMTALGLGGSAVGAGLGAGLLGLGAAGTMGVGMGTDMAGIAQAANDAKAVATAQGALRTAQTSYGPASQQAVTAQLALNTAVSQFSPVAAGAVTQVATMGNTIHQVFNQATGQAEKLGAQIILAFENVALNYIPTIGKFATINMGIIKQALVPLEGWLSSTGGGLGIFQSIEQIFTTRLPTALKAFTNGAEVAIKTIGYLAQYGGGFMQKVADFFEKLNTPAGFSKWEGMMASLIGDFKAWEGLIIIIARDLVALFKNDAGLGVGIVSSLTAMLTKLHEWLVSSTGKAQLQSIFAVHKQQILDLLQLIPPLVRAFEPILQIMPAMTVLTLPFITALVDLLNAFERIPFGIGATVAGLLGFSLLLGHLVGYGKAFGWMKDIFTAALPAIGTFVGGLTGLDTAFGGVVLASTAAKIALGVGVVGALVALGFALDYIFQHFGTLDGVLATAAVAFAGFAIAVKTGALTNFGTWLSGLVTSFQGAGAEATAAAATMGAAEGTMADDAVASSAAIKAANDATLASMTGVSAAAEEQAAALATWNKAVLGSLAGGASAGVGAGEAAVSTEAAVAAPSMAEMLGVAGGLSAILPVLAVGLAAAAAGFYAFQLTTNSSNTAIEKFMGGVDQMPTKTLPQLQQAVDATKAKMAELNAAISNKGVIDIGTAGPGTTALNPTSNLGAQGAAYLGLQANLKKYEDELKVAGDNSQWLADHFHITTGQAQQLAQSIGLDLTKNLNTTGPQVYKFGAALQTIGGTSSGAQQALSHLAQTANQSMAAVANSTAQAASAMNTTMQTFSNITTAITNGMAGVMSAGHNITAFYFTQVGQAQQFSAGITQALADGFNPTIIQQALAAGPAQGLATIQSLLAGYQSGGAGFVSTTNNQVAALQRQSNQLVEMARLMNAIQVVAPHISPAQLATMQADMGNAVAIWQNQMQNGGRNVSAAFVNGFKSQLGSGAAGLTAVANEYGMALPNVINADGSQVTLAVYQGQLAKFYAALNAGKPGAAAAAKGPAGALPTAIAGETQATQEAVNRLVNGANATLSGSKPASDAAAKPPAAALPNALTAQVGAVSTAAAQHVGTLQSTLLSGKPIIQNAANAAAATVAPAFSAAAPASGHAATSHIAAIVGVFTGSRPILSAAGDTAATHTTTGVANHDAKPAGVALVNGIIAGIQSRQSALNTAALDVVKNAINSARPDVGGQSLGVALDQGIEAGISGSASIVSTAAAGVVNQAKAAANAAAGNPKSPAPVFIPLGMSIGQGIAFGITQSAPLITDAAQKAITTAMNASTATAMASMRQFAAALQAAATAPPPGSAVGATGSGRADYWTEFLKSSGVKAADALTKQQTGMTPYFPTTYNGVPITGNVLPSGIGPITPFAPVYTPTFPASTSGQGSPLYPSYPLSNTDVLQGRGGGTVTILSNPTYTINGDPSPSTIATVKQLQQQHDDQLIAAINARGG